MSDFIFTSEMKNFDELSRKMWSEPLFTNAVINWKFAPGYLYQLTCEVGFERTLEEIRQTHRKRGINNRGLYLRTRLKTLIDPNWRNQAS